MNNHWSNTPIGNLGKIVTGKTPPTKEEKYFNGAYMFVSPKDLSHDSKRINVTATTITKEAILKFKNQVLPQNSIFFTSLSYGFGKMGIAKEKCITNQQIHSIIVDQEKYDYKFIFYLLKNSIPIIRSYDAGIVTPIVPKSVFSKIKLNVPTLPTQRKIAAILSAYDDLIENNLKRIKLLEEKAQLTYEEWFVRMRFPGHETTPIDAETGLPEGWERVKLKDLTSYIGRGISPKYVPENGISIINQKCIRNNRVNINLARMCDRSKKITEDKKLQQFDILVNSTGTGTLGRVAQITEVTELMSVDTHVTIVRSNVDTDRIYLGRVVEYNQPRIENIGKGSTNQIELSRKDLGNLDLVKPTNKLQKLYGEQFINDYLSIEILTKQNQLLKEARDILLPRLMTGMIDVDKLNIKDTETSPI